MLTTSVDTMVSVTGGQLIAGSGSRMINGLCIDSRQVSSGCVFVALLGENADGHEFAREALQAGARALLVSRSPEGLADILQRAAASDAAIERVADTVVAVQQLAAYHRSRLHCEVIGITGSTGKTSTKDFVDAVLSTSMTVVSTQGNQNNELGVPLTLLRADARTEAIVVEMGMRGLGQIAKLCKIARPTLGLLTNVGTSHIELLGTQDAVAEAKAELVRALPETGAAFLNGDDAYSDSIATMTQAPVTLYGLSERCAVRACDIELDAESRASFELRLDHDAVRVALAVPGRHNVYNALAAAALGAHLGVPSEAIATGLESAHLSAMRMEVFTSASGVTIVNDAYNANPVSMRAAVETLAAMETDGRRIAVLGDMAELGSLTELAHFRIGEAVARLGVDELVAVGPRAARIAEGARAAGLAADHVHGCVAAPEAGEVLDDLIEPGDVVLVKASRVMGLETVVEGMVTPR